ncbi:hypothetical protein EOD39_2064 [Acipenser ruthenus]|uniref:Uncharacterized protein n=1 Tax=Acipenser ruthenus TaxID=7906 RepID=A0A444U466_ACIRT|nr:hypothetical protein EOD39_2064 [Acipenser ruthenus]
MLVPVGKMFKAIINAKKSVPVSILLEHDVHALQFQPYTGSTVRSHFRVHYSSPFTQIICSLQQINTIRIAEEPGERLGAKEQYVMQLSVRGAGWKGSEPETVRDGAQCERRQGTVRDAAQCERSRAERLRGREQYVMELSVRGAGRKGLKLEKRVEGVGLAETDKQGQ